MPDMYSFLQTVRRLCRLLARGAARRLCRTAGAFITALSVVMVAFLFWAGYAGARSEAAPAFYGESAGDRPRGLYGKREEFGVDPVSRLEVSLIAGSEQGRRFVGGLLERRIQDELARSDLEVETLTKEILTHSGQGAQEAPRGGPKPGQAEKAIRCTARDYEVLLRIVQAEAGICDAKGKIMVANVIINRVRNSEFPDTITDVVYERSQFSPVSDGRINTCEITQETIECVDRALAGEDYSEGALYFMNRRGSASSNIEWFDRKLTFVKEHGGHEFFK